MTFVVDTTCELWNLEKPLIPRHSRLYHLKPIGVGTPYVETLTGYVARLAEAHCVPTGILVLSEIAPFMKKEYVFDNKSGGLEKIFANKTQSLNGMGSWTISLVRVLESLTLCSDLRFLTMLTWAEVISQRKLLRPVRAWCPTCYEGWRLTEQMVYEPLLWSLNAVKVCPAHYQSLSTQCPHCHLVNTLLAWRSRPGYCSKCGEWLGICPKAKSTDKGTRAQDELKWQKWVIDNSGDLIATTPHLASSPLKNKIAKTLSTYVNPQISGNISTFAHSLGVSITQVCRWFKGEIIPQYDTLLQICNYFGTSLLNFLTEEAIAPNSSKIVTQSQTQPKRKRVTSHGSINDSSQVKRLLQAALNECPPRSLTEIAEGLGYRSCSSLFYHASDLCHAISARYADYQKTERLKEIQYALEAVLGSQEYPPPPMHEVAKRLGISVPTLKQYCPDLCNTITARCTSYRQESKTKRVQKLCQEIRQVALKLHTEGVAPTASRISEHLSKPAAILRVEAVAAVREVRRELGWEK